MAKKQKTDWKYELSVVSLSLFLTYLTLISFYLEGAYHAKLAKSLFIFVIIGYYYLLDKKLFPIFLRGAVLKNKDQLDSFFIIPSTISAIVSTIMFTITQKVIEAPLKYRVDNLKLYTDIFDFNVQYIPIIIFSILLVFLISTIVYYKLKGLKSITKSLIYVIIGYLTLLLTVLILNFVLAFIFRSTLFIEIFW